MNCELCGEPMPEGEEMFRYHGYSGPCPNPPVKSTRPISDERRQAIEECMAIASECEDDDKTAGAVYMEIKNRLLDGAFVSKYRGNDTGGETAKAQGWENAARRIAGMEIENSQTGVERVLEILREEMP